MNRLKTLRDIKGIFSNGDKKFGTLHINEEELKKEAIKWIKELETQNTPFNPPSTNPQITNEYAIIDWIKHFFNITNKDLKR